MEGFTESSSVGKCNRMPFPELLEHDRKVVRNSKMFLELKDKLASFVSEIDRVRCLALGSFSKDSPARYQLALLLEMIDFLTSASIRCSVYDPVFNKDDIKFIESLGDSWSVDEKVPWDLECSRNTLYYLPHAPLSLSEVVVKEEQPRIFLANHLLQHTDRYTKQELFEKYPLMSKLVNLLNLGGLGSCPMVNDGFVRYVSKKSRKRRNKIQYREPELEFDAIESYFTDCRILTDFESGKLLRNSIWLNAFSDLTLHCIE
ncbi:HCL201Wp [Eremothecium sinecaudum]|uniref:HCL201Wp n=1 Tax=Eremothecium sinecaudum TaxID=45286 RepID=A0A109UYJ4_9SACH|nr:HCL201Wp [Eremothecium sinecaudum]AMD19950.1 HCL201Wp [Eremothecium sinecaudum]